jgi:hypothetical protein
MIRLIVTLLCLITTLPVFAQTTSLTVTGEGPTVTHALQDAFRKAAEKSYGIYVYIDSKAENYQLTRNEINTISQGFIRGYEILTTTRNPEHVFVTVQVQLDKDQMMELIRTKKQLNWDQVMHDAAQIEFRQDQLRRYKTLLQNLTQDRKRLLEQAYTVELAGYEIDDIGVDYVRGSFLVTVAENNAFWMRYLEIIEMMQAGNEHFVHEGLFGEVAFADCTGFRRQDEGIGIPVSARVHKSLTPYLAPPIKIRVSIDQHERELTLYKNAVFFGDVAHFQAPGKVTKRADCVTELAQSRMPFKSASWDSFFKRPNVYPYRVTEKNRDDLVTPLLDAPRFYATPDREHFAISGAVVQIKIPFEFNNETELQQIRFNNIISIIS